MEAACEASSVCNTSQLVGTQDGQSVVPCYDWASILGGHFKRIPGLLSLHSFAVSAEAPNVLMVREFSDSVAKLHDIGKGSCPVGLPPADSTERPVTGATELYSEICEFCREGMGDLVCLRLPQPEAGPSAAKRKRDGGPAHRK